ncbi:MAG TPA: phosphoribosylformylglycinamidine cyclo-ligase [Oligoflexia bacterium]|nr:phosphoribosylformylglycinamidine cyclo-ligase [Oligoflexia bacterium]HMR25789.1 phosphoribosylformylglycinamidine cyclo-ligase [Oligoflexia bacterium]
MSEKSLSYSDAGVDIKKGDDFVNNIKPLAKETFHKHVQNNIGGFASVASIPSEYKEPMIVTATDGVGTKLLLARELNHYEQLGQDLVAMCVNDLLTLGASPFLFLDYYACDSINLQQATEIIKSIAKACKLSGCALVGGETAEMPGLYAKNDFDLSGFCVGLVDKANIIDGKNIEEGDVVIGLPSSGVHSNGFSLVRKVIEHAELKLNETYPGFETSLGQSLLKGTRIYVKTVLSMLKQGLKIKGMAHITGGGIAGNLSRILPSHCDAIIKKDTWQIPTLFSFLQSKGNIDQEEMFKTFNMGLGYLLVCSLEDSKKLLENYLDAVVVGSIKSGNQKVSLV